MIYYQNLMRIKNDKKIKEWFKDLKVDNENYLIQEDTSKRKLRKIINYLELNNDVLKGIIKDELYLAFINQINDEATLKRLKNENKELRSKLKNYKEELLLLEKKKGNK
jgi:hypothetical protein